MNKSIKLGAIIGTLTIMLLMAYQLYESNRQLRVLTENYIYFKNDYVTLQGVNERYKTMYDNLQSRYDELANGSYCINSIEEGNE